jgi:hypothetical protein
VKEDKEDQDDSKDHKSESRAPETGWKSHGRGDTVATLITHACPARTGARYRHWSFPPEIPERDHWEGGSFLRNVAMARAFRRF